MCINGACCERFFASLCKHLCTCVFVVVGLVAILIGVGMLQDESIDKIYGYATIGGGAVVCMLGGCVKYCCPDATISKEGQVYQTF